MNIKQLIQTTKQSFLTIVEDSPFAKWYVTSTKAYRELQELIDNDSILSTYIDVYYSQSKGLVVWYRSLLLQLFVEEEIDTSVAALMSGQLRESLTELCDYYKFVMNVRNLEGYDKYMNYMEIYPVSKKIIVYYKDSHSTEINLLYPHWAITYPDVIKRRLQLLQSRLDKKTEQLKQYKATDEYKQHETGLDVVYRSYLESYARLAQVELSIEKELGSKGYAVQISDGKIYLEVE